MRKCILAILILLVAVSASADYYSYDQEKKKEFSEAEIIKLVKKEILKEKKEQLVRLTAEIERMENEIDRGY